MSSPPVYSLRIFGHGGLVASAGTVGPIVPDSFIYVVRDIDVVEETGVGTPAMVVKNQTLGFLTVFSRPSGDPTGHYQWQGRQVYGPGEQVGFEVFSGTWAIACSGYQLTLP